MKSNLFKKHKLLGAVILTSILGFFAAILIYSIFDTYFNGMFSDWLYDNYMVNTYSYEEDGTAYIVTEPDWLSIKALLQRILFTVTVLAFVTATIIYYLVRKRISKKVISDSASFINQYFNDNSINNTALPEEYSDIEAQIDRIKSDIRHNEQITQDEIRRKNELITYLAHDLKTPLTSVVGYLSLLDEAKDMPETQREKYIHIALDKSFRLENLINEFFEITRYNLHQMVIEKETIDLYYMIVQLIDEFYPLLSSHKNTVEIKIDENLTVYGDADKLARVFNNILKNAVYYSYTNSVITVSAHVSDGLTEISFSNKGKTISENKLNAIFEKFFRLDDARSTNSGGAGLGLAIAKEIIDLHDGFITAVSKDETTEFIIRIPDK